ncbi:MAG: peptidoglycan-associated lipoprotein Pal [Holophaga sp.]
MSVPSKLTPVLTAAVLVAAGMACRKPAPAPQPEAPKAAAPAPVKTEQAQPAPDDSQRKADEAAEAARKAAAEAEALYRKAAEAALKDVHFDYDKSAVRDEDKPVLTAIADFMKKYPQANVAIDGNCDERGTVEYNLALGDRRAAAARDYLVGLGVPVARLSTTSYGKEKPVCTEHEEPCWFKNRRAHFSLK